MAIPMGSVVVVLLLWHVFVVVLQMIRFQRFTERQFDRMPYSQLLAHVHHGFEGFYRKVHSHVEVPGKVSSSIPLTFT